MSLQSEASGGRIGPSVEHSVRRLLEIPSDMTEAAVVAGANTTAVVHDVVEALFGTAVVDEARSSGEDPVDAQSISAFSSTHRGPRSSACALAVAWLLADRWFLEQGSVLEQGRVWQMLTPLAARLAEDGSASTWISEPIRREELVRSVLAGLDLVPEGESVAQAQDRLSAISSAERRRVLAAAREAEQRAADIRAQLAAQAAREAADKMTRE
jgi:hypothetical protein